jgi:PAS domain S-box-containing protein
MVLTQLATAIEQTADGVVITNREGIIGYVNPAFETIAGFSRDECVGRKTSLLRSGVQTPRFYDTLWSTILSGQPFHAVMTNRAQNGRLFDYEQTITPIRARDGSIDHFIAIGRDVTGRRRARAARLHYRLEYESRRIAGALYADAGQYLALAHMTLADIADDVAPGAAERLQEVRQYLDSVEERLRHATRGVHPRVISERGLVDAVRLLAERCARRTGILIAVEAGEALRCPAATETLVYRVVQEALGTLSRRGGTQRVTVVLARQAAGRRAQDEAIRCSIRDEGIGFDVSGFVSGSKESFGLRALRERLRAVGGALDLIPGPGTTELLAVIPVAVACN